MHRSLTLFYFLLATFFTLLTPFTPWISLQYFAPYLILQLYNQRKSQALTQAFFCGSILDLLSSGTSIGFWALNFILTLMLLGRIKHLFFVEKILTLPVLTFFFSGASTLFYVLLANIFCTKTHLTLNWLLTDLILLPGIEACYALILFSIPIHFLSTWLPQAKRKTSSLNLKEN